MAGNQKICTRCILDSTIPDITFDSDGICNYCKIHDEQEKKFPLNESGKQKLNQIIDEIKKNGKDKQYDCIVGISGGCDSIFSLYNSVKLGLKPLAITFDNGWNSEIAVSNIKNATTKLNVDLETFVVDWEEFKSIQVSFLKASVPDSDVPSDIGLKSTLYRAAVKNNIRYIITGGNFRTEGQIPRKWSYMDGRYIKEVHRKFSNKILKNYPNLTLFDYFYYLFIKKIKVIRILNYVNYQKSKAKEVIKKELCWRDYGGKHYESIFTRFNQTYMRYKKFGFDMRLIEYSALVRAYQMTRDEALDKITELPYNEKQLEEDVEYVIKKLGLTEEAFYKIYNLPQKSFLDYPTYYPMIKRMRPFIDFVSKFVSRL